MIAATDRVQCGLSRSRAVQRNSKSALRSSPKVNRVHFAQARTMLDLIEMDNPPLSERDREFLDLLVAPLLALQKTAEPGEDRRSRQRASPIRPRRQRRRRGATPPQCRGWAAAPIPPRLVAAFGRERTLRGPACGTSHVRFFVGGEATPAWMTRLASLSRTVRGAVQALRARDHGFLPRVDHENSPGR